MAHGQSSQDFVRALKAPLDPPVVGGRLKIDIARRAWDDPSFFVPNKSEVIVEWLLTKLLKEKGKAPPDNPVLDIRYWTLILDIVSLQDASPAASSRALKTWLALLLSRIPIAPIVLVFLSQINDLEEGSQTQLSEVISSCLNVLWPLGVQKLSVEVILEVWGTLLGVLNVGQDGDGLVRIGLLITASYRNHLENFSNKKKIHSTFLQSYLQPWLEFVAATVEHSASSLLLLKNSFTAGIETIFNFDILRTTQDNKSESLLFDAFRSLKPTSRNVVLQTLPRIFEAYILAIRKYRNTLFSHGSNQVAGAAALDELHTAGMHFFALCQGLLEEEGPDKLCWEIRDALLVLVERENLFHKKQLTAESVLNRNIELSLQALDLMSKDEVEKSTLAVKCLANITRIDYDLILPSIPLILPRVLKLQGTGDEIFVFLDLLLSYFTKTRTMSTYIGDIVSATSFKTISKIPGNSREVYRLCLSGSLLHSKHLDRLTKGLHTFITPGQISIVITSITECIKSCWEEYRAADHHAEVDGDGSRKKRKTEKVEEKTGDPEILATTFSLSARLASVIMSSLAITALPREKHDKIRGMLVEFHASLGNILSKCFKRVAKRGRRDAWSVQVVAAAALRLQYALEISRGLVLLPSLDERLVGKMIDALDDNGLLPELVLETFRQLLHQLSVQNEFNGQATIDKLLEYLETNFRPLDGYWSGEGYQLTFGEQEKADSALALLHLVLERWLPDIDVAASEPQLGRLIRVITSIKPGSIVDSGIGGLRPWALLLRTLHSAQFWELHHMRVVLLAYISDITKSFDAVVAGKLKTSQFVEAISAYQLLLLFPIEYFTKSSRIDFITRALAADAYLNHMPLKNNFTTADKLDSWKVLRVFVKRVFVQLGSIDNQPDITGLLDHLLVHQDSDIHGDSEFTSATLGLCDLYFLELLKEAEKSRPDQLLKVLAAFSQNSILETPSIQSQAFIRIVERLTTSSAPDKLGDQVTEILRTIHNNSRSSLLPKICTLAANGFSSDSDNDLLAGWGCLLSLGTWLNIRDGKSPLMGHTMASKLVLALRSVHGKCGKHLELSCVSTFSVLLEELSYRTDNQRTVHLDVVIAVYVAFAESLEAETRSLLDILIAKICKRLPPPEFTRILDLISTTLSTENTPIEQLVQLVKLSVVLLHNHPQNTLKYMQKFATQCFNNFAGMTVFITGLLQLRLQVLEFIARHCSDRPSALRLLDLGSICSLLSRHLAPSTTHDDETAPEICHKIVAIISALIRLRRDLVTHILPNLGMILRQLLLSMRSCRPHLGAKQSSIVMNSQPQWISAVQPLRAEEGKAVARLLETLNTKTIVRSNMLTTENLKAESLAKPFSKHAAYVLKAYIEAVNDPLCILSSNLRKELQSGLYALCSMMSDHSRDAMMVSALDAGGKTTLKALWKEYERQKYVGKG